MHAPNPLQELDLEEPTLRFMEGPDFKRHIRSYWRRVDSENPKVRQNVHREVVEKLYCVQTLGKFFDLLGKTYGDLPALTDAREADGTNTHALPTINYRQLSERITQEVERLRSQGIRPGTRIGMMGENSSDLTITLFACMSMGAVVIPFGSRSDSGQTPTQAMERGLVDVVFVDGVATKSVLNADAQSHLGMLRDHGLVAGISAEAQEKLGRPFSAIRSENDQEGVDAYSTAVAMYSSGTSGVPTLELLRHCDLLYPALTLPGVYRKPPGKRTLEVMPFYHIYGLTTLLAALSGGSHVYLANAESMKKRGEHILRASRPHLMPSVPYGWDLLKQKIEKNLDLLKAAGGIRAKVVDWIQEAIAANSVAVAEDDLALAERKEVEGADLASMQEYWNPVLERKKDLPTGIAAASRRMIGNLLLRYKVLPSVGLENLRPWEGLGISGGGKTPAEVLAYIRSLGVDLRPGYGATQSPITTTPNPNRLQLLTGSGEPLPGVSLAFPEHPSGKHELEARGPSVARGVLGSERSHELATGDSATMVLPVGDVTLHRDEDVLIGSRLGRNVKLSQGLFVNLSEYEDAIRKLTGVAQAIVAPDEATGCRSLRAYVIPLKRSDDQKRYSIELKQVQESTQQLFSRFSATVSSIEILDGLPVSALDDESGVLYSRKGELNEKRALERWRQMKNVDPVSS